MSQLTFIPQRTSHTPPGTSTDPDSSRGGSGSVGDRSDRATLWSNVWNECQGKDKKGQNGNTGDTSGTTARANLEAGGVVRTDSGIEAGGRQLPGAVHGSADHAAAQTVIRHGSLPASVQSGNTETPVSFAGSNFLRSGENPQTGTGPDASVGAARYVGTPAGDGNMGMSGKKDGKVYAEGSVAMKAENGTGEPRERTGGGAVPGTERDTHVKKNIPDYRPVSQWMAMKLENIRGQGTDGSGSNVPGEAEKLTDDRLAAARTVGQSQTEGLASGMDKNHKPGWKEKFRALFSGKQASRRGGSAGRHEDHVRSFAERGSEPVAVGTSAGHGIAAVSGEAVPSRPVQAVMPAPFHPGAIHGISEQAHTDWENLKIETDFTLEETDERKDAALQLSQIGRLPMTSADVRRELLPDLVRMYQHARESAESRNDAWQNHRIQIANGSNMRISTREVDGVLQLKLGSSNTELNRLLQQHFNEIREHLEKECDMTVELQLDSGQADGFDRFFGESGKDGAREHYREMSESRTEPRPVEKVAPQPVRHFGYNQMEWTI